MNEVKKRLLVGTLLVLYCLLLVKVMIFKDIPAIRVGNLLLNFGGTNAGYAANLKPFKSIVWYLRGGHGPLIGGINLAGNIILLMPMGFLVPVLNLKFGWKKMVVLGLCLSLTIEVIQYWLRVGIFDIDDVLLNVLGVMMGYWLYLLLRGWVARRQFGRMVIVGAMLVLLAGVGYYRLSIVKNGDRDRRIEIDQAHRDVTAASRRGDGLVPGDLCNGTGGTGRIIAVEYRAIVIRRNDGKHERVRLHTWTRIRTSRGMSTAAALTPGQRVTLVTDESDYAVVVMVCGGVDD